MFHAAKQVRDPASIFDEWNIRSFQTGAERLAQADARPFQRHMEQVMFQASVREGSRGRG